MNAFHRYRWPEHTFSLRPVSNDRFYTQDGSLSQGFSSLHAAYFRPLRVYMSEKRTGHAGSRGMSIALRVSYSQHAV
jgi:hypothetical protein